MIKPNGNVNVNTSDVESSIVQFNALTRHENGETKDGSFVNRTGERTRSKIYKLINDDVNELMNFKEDNKLDSSDSLSPSQFNVDLKSFNLRNPTEVL